MAIIEVNGITIHYQLVGHGDKLVVFNHGLIMDNLSSWYFTLGNKITPFARAFLYDLRGHGKSSRPKSGYRIHDMVEDLEAARKILGFDDPFILVGNSFGGLLSLAYAIAHPRMVRGLILVDAHFSDEGFAADMKATLELQGEERDRMIALSFKNWLGRHSKRKRTRLAETASQLVYETDLIGDLQKNDVFPDEQLKTIDAPVLLVYGENSDIRQKGEHLANVLPRAEFHVFTGCSHSVLWEATAELCALTSDWIKKL